MKNFRFGQFIWTLVIAWGSLQAPAAAVGAAKSEQPDAKTNLVSSETDYPRLNLEALTRPEIAELLGWVEMPKDFNLCHGLYQDPILFYNELIPANLNKTPMRINADYGEFAHTGESLLMGDVTITQPDRRLKADQISLIRDAKGKPTTVELLGNVEIREPGKLMLSDKAHVNLQDKSGKIKHVLYRMNFSPLLSDKQRSPQQLEAEENKGHHEELSAWGMAHRLYRSSQGIIDVIKGSYSTCPPLKNTWTVKANKMQLDRETGRGTATNVRLYVKDVPIMYVPYFNFPLDDRRTTGFLFPTLGHSNDDGDQFAIPFYWNIAPNYDATFTPHYMSDRGVFLQGEFRYLTSTSTGNLHGAYINKDREFSDFRKNQLNKYPETFPGYSRLENTSTDRAFISLKDLTHYSPNWYSYLYLNYVTDDYYFYDFYDDPAQITPNQLINQADINYISEHWNFVGRLQGYQTLHPINQAPVDNQYRKLPELILNGHYPNLPYEIDFQLRSSAVNFDRQKNPGQSFIPVTTGTRANLNPILTLPMFWLWGYVNPQIQLVTTQYNLNNQPMQRSEAINRTLPIFNVEAGLFFERETIFSSHEYEQTLEPRIFYLYVPYVNQNDIPLFDTNVQPFNFAQLFRTNRFNGLDRIGDANQLSYALTTRFLKKQSGEEKLRAGIGQIVYFENRRVTIRNAPDIVTRANITPLDSPTSPIVAAATYNINKTWHFNSSLSWDPNFNEPNNGYLGFQFKKDSKHIINVGYSYLRGGDPELYSDPLSYRNDLNQSDLSFIWPVADNIVFMGRWNYNLSHGYTQNALFGLQYDACCWAVRALAGHTFKQQKINTDLREARPSFNDRVYVEFVLKGLGALSPSSPHTLIADSIPGYENTLLPFPQ